MSREGRTVDFRDIKRAAEQQGWTVRQTNKGHWQFLAPAPSKAIVVSGGTPSDRRAIHNLLSGLKREGFIWPWPPPKGQE